MMMIVFVGFLSCSQNEIQTGNNDINEELDSGEEKFAENYDDSDYEEDNKYDEEEADEVALGDEEFVGENGTYMIENGDTYMWIAYKLYGDYGRWRELASKNSHLSSKDLKVGDVINYELPEEEYEWEELGTPYRIVPGDSLTKISLKIYGESTLWTDLWKNNRRMIDSPDRIFSGFTLFYLEKDVEKEVAAK